jgi:hypothetical protein
MRRIQKDLEIKLGLVSLLLCSGVALAQCPTTDATLPAQPLTYPMTSDQYTVQYQIGGGGWTNATVYISYYGETDASPYRTNSGYTAGKTSMSFVSIPAQANAMVQLQVTKVSGAAFQASDQVSVRPSAKPINVTTGSNGIVQISTLTAANFGGEQFILWWNRGANGAGVEGLAFFLNPPYTRPAGSNVKIVATPADLTGDLSAFDTLDFESTVAIGSTGNVAYPVPANILNIFLGPNAWVQGKLRFAVTGMTTHIFGPGVLDGSRFNYLNRDCATDDGDYSLSSEGANGVLEHFVVDGIIISDQNHAANDAFHNSTVNNVKTLGWNSENAALRLNDSTSASNVFIRSGDDSLMIWGSGVTVTNATVWQNFNGGVVNLGWLNNSPGDNGLVDGLWVVKTDWLVPTSTSWTALSQPGPPNPLDGQNNAVFASLMVPSTMYGAVSPPVFRNIYVEDPPQVLFSLKIIPPVSCAGGGVPCTAAGLLPSSSVNLTIENLHSPQSIVQNSIGFENIPAGYTTVSGDTVSTGFTLTGTMNIGLENVMLTSPSGTVTQLTAANAATVGNLSTNGANIDIAYASFFTGEDSLGSGVYYLQFPDANLFGYYNVQTYPILYHYDLGFESFVDPNDGHGGAYFYDFASTHWFYTSASLFPYLYDFTRSAWLYYFPDTKNAGHYTTNPRYFVNLTTGQIFTM